MICYVFSGESLPDLSSLTGDGFPGGTQNGRPPPPYPNSAPFTSTSTLTSEPPPLSHPPRRGRGRGRGRGGGMRVVPLPAGVVPRPNHDAAEGLQKCHKFLSSLLRLSVCLTTQKQHAVRTVLQKLIVSVNLKIENV